MQADREVETLSRRLGYQVHHWDKRYAVNLVKNDLAPMDPFEVADFLPLKSVVSGLGNLCERMFGATVEWRNPRVGESWAPSVTCLDVAHPQGGDLGTIYLDLLERGGKSQFPAHYVVQCGRRLEDGSYQLPKVFSFPLSLLRYKHKLVCCALVDGNNGDCQDAGGHSCIMSTRVRPSRSLPLL